MGRILMMMGLITEIITTVKEGYGGEYRGGILLAELGDENGRFTKTTKSFHRVSDSRRS